MVRSSPNLMMLLSCIGFVERFSRRRTKFSISLSLFFFFEERKTKKQISKQIDNPIYEVRVLSLDWRRNLFFRKDCFSVFFSIFQFVDPHKFSELKTQSTLKWFSFSLPRKKIGRSLAKRKIEFTQVRR